MSDLLKWRKMVFDVIDKNSAYYCNDVRALNADDFNKKMEDVYTAPMHSYFQTWSGSFRTVDKESSWKINEDTALFYKGKLQASAWGEGYEVGITIEGIYATYTPRKVFKLFSPDDITSIDVAMTFKELAERGFKEEYGRFTFQVQGRHYAQYGSNNNVTVEIPKEYRIIFNELIDLYNNNKELYEDALDEYVGDDDD